MKISINGQMIDIPDSASVKSLLDTLKLKPETVAVEINLEIIPKKEYNNYTVKEGDKVEIISYVGGG